MEMLRSYQGTELSSFAGRTKQDLSIFQAHVFFPAGLCDQCIGRFNFCLRESKALLAPPPPRNSQFLLDLKVNHGAWKTGERGLIQCACTQRKPGTMHV